MDKKLSINLIDNQLRPINHFVVKLLYIIFVSKYKNIFFLQELPEHQRGDAVSSMVYEANARVRDPVYGCVGTISSLQQQIDVLQAQLAVAQAEVVHMRMRQFSSLSIPIINSSENISPSSRHTPSQTSTRSPFSMDMVVDHANLGESLWSC